MGDPDGWQAEHRSEVEGETSAPRVIAARAVYEQRIRGPLERMDGRRERRAFAQREQPRLVRRSGFGPDHGGVLRRRSSCPERVAGGTVAAFRA